MKLDQHGAPTITLHDATTPRCTRLPGRGGQVRFGPLMRSLAVFSCIVASWRPATAQQASPYVPLHHWATPHIEHLIARGAIADPTPLSRPFRAADLVRALRGMDSVHVTPAEWRVARRLIAQLDRGGQAPLGRFEGHVSLAAATHALRDPLGTRCRPTASGCAARDPAASRMFASGGLGATLFFGPVVVVTHPYFDTRLKFDPDYYGKKDRVLAGRNAEAYLSGQWRFGELFFGALDRNWGPSPLEGLLLSPAPYSYDQLAVSVGTERIRLEGVLTQLDDFTDTTGTVQQRYLVAHRLILRPGGTTLVLWEGSVIAGRDRELEPWFANILNLGLLAQYDQGSAPNNLVGVDAQTRLGRTTIFSSLLIDDIQVDRATPGDQEPTAYGLTLGAQGAFGAAAWTAWYTRVANLAYRTPEAAETVMRRNVGLARDFSDYDQLSLRAGLLAGAGVLLAPEVTLVRQGEGDFRRTYPAVAAFDTTPTFLAGIVERTLRLALSAHWPVGTWQLDADAGVHLVSNANHLSGESEARFVGRVGITYRFKKESVLP
jgi:hypothetical protein